MGSKMAFGAFYSLLPIRYSLVAVALVAATGVALAQTWPQRPVKVLVPFAAGGNIDVMGRLAASRLSEAFGQHIPAMFVPISEALPQARAGLIRMLAVSSATRSPEAPEVPTIGEQAYTGF